MERLMNGDWQEIGKEIETGKKDGLRGHSDGTVD